MKKNYLVILLSIILMQSCVKPPIDEVTIFYQELAYRHAPIHYQDTDNTNAKADYLTRFNYDQNWISNDNWEHLKSGDLAAYVYYSVVETSTHWFIVYGFFHPQDWTDGSFAQEHENDMEGILSIVRKDGSQFGTIEGMITVAYDHFYSYVPSSSSLTHGNETIDGQLSFSSFDGQMHPKTCQEAKGHGVKAWPYAGDFSGNGNQDGIIYYPSKTNAEVPSSGNDRNVSYKLIDITKLGNLWTLQMIEPIKPMEQTFTYAHWGTLKGDDGGGCGTGITVTCATNSPHTPWGWDDKDDGANYAGELALDPAAIVNYYYNGLGNFSNQYITNRYLEDLKRQGFKDSFLPNGWPNDLKLSKLYSKLP